MPREIEPQLLEQIKQHAVRRLRPDQSGRINLSVNRQIVEKGEEFGPSTQRMIADATSLIVFCDDDPLANWGHPCRYLLYDPATGELLKEIPARLPSGQLEPFYMPVRLPKRPLEPVFRRYPQPTRCPMIAPDGQRYALLFSGFTMQRFLNDLEFLYRTLIDTYGIPPENITVLSFDGTLTVVNDDWLGTSAPPGVWFGDNTPYQIVINGKGTLASLEAAFATLAAQMGPNDELFIHTSNHGDTNNLGAYLAVPGALPPAAEYPTFDWSTVVSQIYASAFARGMLATLPPFRALVVMMEQCGSGGFGPDILSASPAASTSFAAACAAGLSSNIDPNNGIFDAFAYQWIAAMAGSYPGGVPLFSNPDTDGSFVIDTSDAFTYAKVNDISSDIPVFSGTGTNPNGLVLAEEYTLTWFWCWIWASFLPPLWEAARKRGVLPQEFRAKVNQAAGKLQTEILAESDKALLDVRRKLGLQIKQTLEEALK